MSYIPCLMCGHLFEKTTKRKSPKRYCSNACKQKAYRINHQSKTVKKRTVIELNDQCAYCGESYIAHHNRQMYCSSYCKQAAYRARRDDKQQMGVIGNEVMIGALGALGGSEREGGQPQPTPSEVQNAVTAIKRDPLLTRLFHNLFNSVQVQA